MKNCIALVLIAGFLFVSNMDKNDADLAMGSYCSKVAIWKGTEGKGGHPDYNGVYAAQCLK